MALVSGTRLGSYEIAGLLGQGGMGEVYRATDTKLKRQVALKVLPASVARDVERLARFEREAEVLAALNHPHIAQIYGFEDAPDPSASSGQPIRALVMELVEGPTLADRIAQGPLPTGEALTIARQIADALEAAHEQGIVHRDLKPANIKVRDDGTVKVLDFGLAKALEPGARNLDPGTAALATVTTPAMTQAGIILGTAAYMSPEQAAGRPTDRRSDIWAFGVVLLEMLTGKPVFEGETVSHVLAAVLKDGPDWSTLPANTPHAIRTLLRRCLERDRRRRLDSAVALRLEIDEALAAPAVLARPTEGPASAPPAAVTNALPWALSAAFALALAAAAVAWGPWGREAPATRSLVRLDVDLGADVSLPAATSAGSSVAISPDGTRLVYASGSPPRLFARRLDLPKAIELPGTQGATTPFFSPDGQWVAFVAGNRLSKVSVEGGAPVPIASVGVARHGTWGEDNNLAISSAGGLLRITADGGAPITLAQPTDGELGLVHPQVLPGGRAILFAVDRAGPVSQNTIEVLTVANSRRKVLVRGGASPRYLPSAAGAGHLIYVSDATLFAIPFDPTTLETRGTAVPVLDDVAYESLIGAGQFDVSRTGTLVYRKSSGAADMTLLLNWIEPSGKRNPLRPVPGLYQFPRVSPDGRQIALSVADEAGQDIWVYDWARDVMTRLTAGSVNNRPVWTPDGRHVAFTQPARGIFIARADGASQSQLLTEGRTQYPSSFTPDGRRLAYFEDGQLWTVAVEEQAGGWKAGKPERFLDSTASNISPAFSPDGRWLAYQSDESGTYEVYVRPFPAPSSGQGGRWQVSNTGGTTPRWSKNSEIVYESGDQLMAVNYTAKGDVFVPGKPRVWIARLRGQWDLAPDGTRVAVLTPVESARSSDHHIVFLQNFSDELKRLVP